MLKYAFRRILYMIPILFGISLITFFLFNVAGGDPASTAAGRYATAEQIAIYKVEPYVIAADVYAAAPHTGRGGWTWYTGSAGWMYRLLLETMLGVNLVGNHLVLTPRLPKKWDSFVVHYRYRQTHYRLRISRVAGDLVGNQLSLDGQVLAGNKIPLVDDQHDHFVELHIN